MGYAKRVILHAPYWDVSSLETFVEDCLNDGVVFIAVVGPDFRRVEDLIDDLIVGDGSDKGRFITTISCPDDTLDEVRNTAALWILDGTSDEPIQEVRLLRLC